MISRDIHDHKRRKQRQLLKMTVALVSLLLSAYPFCISQVTSSTHPAFEVSVVKLSSKAGPDITSVSRPGGSLFKVTNMPLRGLLSQAYGLADSQIIGLPAWTQSTRYDVMGKSPEGVTFTQEQLSLALQQLLADRLGLVAHYEAQRVSGYSLQKGSGILHLTTSKGGPSRSYVLRDGFQAVNLTMDGLCTALTGVLGFPVTDQTGLTGNFDIRLKFRQEDDTESSLPSISAAFMKQLGLRLRSGRVRAKVLRVDRVNEVPTKN